MHFPGLLLLLSRLSLSHHIAATTCRGGGRQQPSHPGPAKAAPATTQPHTEQAMLAINGQSMEGVDFEQAKPLVKNRPLELVFQR